MDTSRAILKIGQMEFIPMADCYRFTIQKVLPQKGYKFAFSIRKRAIDELIRRGSRLEIVFAEHPELSFKENPLTWKNLGKLKKEVHNFKDLPMSIYYYYVNYAGQISRLKQPHGQEVMKI